MILTTCSCGSGGFRCRCCGLGCSTGRFGYKRKNNQLGICLTVMLVEGKSAIKRVLFSEVD